MQGPALLQRNLFYPVRPAVLHLPEDLKQAGWDPSSGSKEQVLATLSILCVNLFYYLSEDFKQAGWDPSSRT